MRRGSGGGEDYDEGSVETMFSLVVIAMSIYPVLVAQVYVVATL